MSNIEKNYQAAKEQYAAIGVDTDKALKNMEKLVISLHCWQGDDVAGFEGEGELTGGIQATGNYPGKARNAKELRADMTKVLSLLPGKYKANVHALYAETEGKVDRNALEPKHFAGWVAWAKENGIGLDFNPSYFSHPLSAEGFTLSSGNQSTRDFWIEHGKRSRKIGEYFGKELGIPCANNIWIPDGYKDKPVDRFAPRARLKDSLDQILKEKIDRKYNIDAVESKLFGIGSESYVVGSNEFYTAYATQNKDKVILTMDAGHYHPTEVISDKISSVLLYMDEVLLHVSRPVRWDSDHVVIYDDELQAIAQEIIRNNFLGRTHIALDYFDASINRIAAWTIGARNTGKAFLAAMLEPSEQLKKLENEGDYTSRLALLEEYKFYPVAAVWDYYCETKNVPVREAWLKEVKTYEQTVLSKR